MSCNSCGHSLEGCAKEIKELKEELVSIHQFSSRQVKIIQESNDKLAKIEELLKEIFNCLIPFAEPQDLVFQMKQREKGIKLLRELKEILNG